ncbi:GNAT family N-acetyltransferase [Aporhodopirellula aestuarii]|uniref:GNAT family N-acetyltransferase n=1 Tax=Aporhodopirellula aestuarii TaxID=2950107 RepID=A0ABT0UD78_9BACT|nr:GNAT family N-acetyltransferase [Aporhodopirellula aestuarii]MCM2374747.1 GNAT family N-acetyltransferase [Aporhodopirellula aestuarii]
MSVLRKIKSHGIIHSAEIIFNRIVPAWIFRFSVGTVLELDLPKLCEVLDKLPPEDFVLRCVDDPVAVAELRETTWNSVPVETTRNHLGYSISRNDDPGLTLGGVWGGIERFNEADLGFQIQLEKDQALIYCAYVSKQARGGGIYTRVLSFAARDLRSRGHDQLRVMIQPWNKASMYIHRKYAVRSLGNVAVIRVFGLVMVFCTGEISKNKTCTTGLLSNPVLITFP